MALPDYEDLYDWAHGQGLEPLPVPGKRPTRKGLGRYLRDTIMHNADDDVAMWRRRWLACTGAYDVLLQRFDVRLPSRTFLMDRIRVLEDLDRSGPAPDDRTSRRRARRWATSH